MARPSKRGIPTPGRRSAPSSSARSKEAARPFLRFHHSDTLRRKTLAVLERLERAPDPAVHREALADVVVELSNAGLEAYFMVPLSDAKVGFIVQQSASLGMAGARQVVGSVIRNIIGRMDGPQLLSVCASIRTFMV
jgi:hypothetical protein